MPLDKEREVKCQRDERTQDLSGYQILPCHQGGLPENLSVLIGKELYAQLFSNYTRTVLICLLNITSRVLCIIFPHAYI